MRARSEEVRGKSEEVTPLFPPRSSLKPPRSLLLALFFSLLALPSSLLALPSPLKPLEGGLQFNGSDWIATGYCPAAGDRFECDVTVADVQPNASAALFGTMREGELERTFAFYVRQGGDDSTTVVYGDTARGGLFPRDKKVSLAVGPDGASWVWDGGSERLSLMPGFARDGVTPLLIGDVNAARREDDSVPAGTGAVMKLHRFRIWRGGLELVHDYVPCSNAVSGVLGVFDLCETAGKNPFRGLNMLSDIPYRAWGREHSSAVECVCSNAFLVLPDTTVLKDNCWYFVRDVVSCGSITVDGAAHLILGAGAKLTARAISGGTLAVYGQPQGVGELTVAGTVSSGLTVEGGFLSAGKISGETFAVVGGTMTADSVDAGTVTIAGGSVRTPVEPGMATNSVGQKVYCVTVAWKEGSEEGRGLRLEGLSGYGTNDIYAIDNRVYLWLPDGTHRFWISDGEKSLHYCAVVKGMDVTVEPGVPVTPGRTTGSYPTAETATNAMKKAVLVPRDDVEAKLGAGASARGTYCDMFGFAVTGGGEAWFVEAVLTPKARTNLAATAAGATRQIPVSAIARLPDVSAIAQLPEDVTTNVTVNGCAPGFFYSLYDGWALTNIVADANATNLNVLCGADAKVTFPEVKKPSDAAGFFKVGVGVTDNVGK